MTNLLRLDIGCGTFKRDGYTGVDVEPSVNPDICAPMWAIPLPDESVSEVYSSHSLEHVTKFQVVPVLKEWKRLLIPGGLITIDVPDLVWVCKNWLWRQTNDWHLDTIFGMSTTPGEEHRTGFTQPIMVQYLNEAGLVLERFENIDSHGQPSLLFVVRKP